jgi:dTDP-4-amino-4,6-dideoxygalactose transaminase
LDSAASHIIPFNKPFLTGKEEAYLSEVLSSGKWGGNGYFTLLCERFLEEKFGFNKCLLTTSCTSALEIAALLLDIKPGDEVIVPSFTFVSTANAFAARGAKVVFADSEMDNPNLDVARLRELITPKTRAIVPVHYAGCACDMEELMRLANQHHLYVIEDAAQALGSKVGSKPLGSFGHLATFSFHETKHVSCGEGGALIINDSRFIERAEVIREKGTNRSAFLRGAVDKYSWVAIGSSYVLSELNAAVLWAQLNSLDDIIQKRNLIYKDYESEFKGLIEEGFLKIPTHYNSQSPHFFYAFCSNKKERDDLIAYLKNIGIQAAFHYLPLHLSSFALDHYQVADLPNAITHADTIIRFPFYTTLAHEQVMEVCKQTKIFFAE